MVCVYLLLISSILFSSACSQLEKSQPQPFYAETAPPQVKEFRWSNGKLPKSFDPAFAAAPPETDVVRAIYEGLTDTNARNLETIPAIAVDWSTTDDNRTWIFKLRHDAKWSNGERITAADFVRSWKRLAALGDKIPLFQLLDNIAGLKREETKNNPPKNTDEIDFFGRRHFNQDFPQIFKPLPNAELNNQKKSETESNTEPTTAPDAEKTSSSEAKNGAKPEQKMKTPVKIEVKFGAEAIDDFTLKVSLLKPDKDFPALVAHPLFRPVYGDGKYFDAGKLSADIVTSGAFRVSEVAPDGIMLERAENFWNKNRIEVERVRFVPMENAEKALEAYRAGELDAVTNADFEPLALKLLTPFDDFQRTPHSALNFYEFNTRKPPFDDRRVREALSIAVERERLTEDEMDGASIPAFGFLPFEDEKNLKLSQNAARAKNLLADAGFAGGENFPVIKLFVNRNNVQQRIARAVAKMWKQNLNVETEIVIKEPAEIETARQTGDFDIIRRGALFPTTDEAMNMLAIFPVNNQPPETTAEKSAYGKSVKDDINADNESNSQTDTAVPLENTGVEPIPQENESNEEAADLPAENANAAERAISTENEAVTKMRAIPLYFSTTYSLVKPYIQGFQTNTLDAPSLKDVSIDNEWQPKKAKGES